MTVIDFKSVGDRASSEKFAKKENSIPIGIKTPLRLGNQNDGIFAMNFNVADQVDDNFRNLLLTNHGERLGHYDFGANLRELAMEYAFDTFDSEAITRIRSAINKFMPFISPRTFEAIPLTGANGVIERVDIVITYDVPRLGIVERKTRVSIFTRG